jgi:hypothetical protein
MVPFFANGCRPDPSPAAGINPTNFDKTIFLIFFSLYLPTYVVSLRRALKMFARMLFYQLVKAPTDA